MGRNVGFLRYLALVGEVGVVFVACIGGGLLLGVVLDKWLKCSPALTILLLLTGIATGFLRVFRLLLPRERQ